MHGLPKQLSTVTAAWKLYTSQVISHALVPGKSWAEFIPVNLKPFVVSY